MTTVTQVMQSVMDVLFDAVGETFDFHSNYTPEVQVVPSITVKILPGSIEYLTTTMINCPYSVVLTVRQDEDGDQEENLIQANECFQSVFEAFGNGFDIKKNVTAVCSGFSMDFVGENRDVPQIEFNFDFTDIFKDNSGTKITNMNLELKG